MGDDWAFLAKFMGYSFGCVQECRETAFMLMVTHQNGDLYHSSYNGYIYICTLWQNKYGKIDPESMVSADMIWKG